MNFSNRGEANECYRDLLRDAERDGYVVQLMNELGRRDLFFLLTQLLHRRDVDQDWLFDRCVDVQANPDRYLDLWAREHYKSTIITFGKTIQDILDSHSHVEVDGKTVRDSFHGWDVDVCVGIFSHTRPIAKAFLSQIMQEFEGNELLKSLYPDILWEYPRREAPKWSVDNGIVVKRRSNPKESTIEAWGLVDGQPVSKHFNILVYDDVVTLESVSTPDQIAKVTDRLAVSYNLGAHGGVKRFIGTRYHFNDTYREILKRGTAIPRIHAATDTGKPDGEPVFLDKPTLDEKRRDMGPYVYSCQMLQNPVADEAQGFKLEWLRHYDRIDPDRMNLYLLCDPAGEKKKDNDFTVMLVIGLGSDGNYYLVDGLRDRLNLTERTRRLFKFHRKYRPGSVGYEKYGKDSDIEHIEDKMEDESYRFDIIPLGGPTPKNDRIRRLVPKFEQFRVYLPHELIFADYEGKARDLVDEFINEEYLSFPVCVHDDILDCMARIIDEDLDASFPMEGAGGGHIDMLTEGRGEEYDPFASLGS